MQQVVIIVAGGSGSRMGSQIPKQFLNVGGRPILMATIETFYQYNSEMLQIVVLPASQMELWKGLCDSYKFTIPHQVTAGGETRFHSVKNGLAMVKGDAVVGIHDGVRPLVSHETLDRCYSGALENGNAIPALPLTESIRRVNGQTNSAEDRNAFVSVQTPQVFRSEQLTTAYDVPFSALFTDDASVVEHAGFAINLVVGNHENIKITTPLDLKIAELLMKTPKP
ncbi:2-C-methyl-D-erythritol 4-phosphate cytidylyltransferase [Breznakibacter xylanolyticus]|uniref:2-C-methyl-D-erythritol 4-phosphate cytidylyltransferase n=1 Tax=Breznakibacter xylanolyticus TaxID=990 RepID=A0A2W7NFW0_9BACT|nr:2-C-methyl-D-erythritol 4-phosphate cytidylyltransferase [Breznakibacter xylanolyticus]PZX19281.1 2-C-methyl-D-erythritol 4-phosphate cytidylyltransferase [Breznakibacter xylanolyticus]